MVALTIAVVAFGGCPGLASIAVTGVTLSATSTSIAAGDAEDYAWTLENGEGTTHAVGTKTSNELGPFDLSGNVFGWCWDWDGAYPAVAVTDCDGPAFGESRTLRGGHWNLAASLAAVGARNSANPSAPDNSYGFRVARR